MFASPAFFFRDPLKPPASRNPTHNWTPQRNLHPHTIGEHRKNNPGSRR